MLNLFADRREYAIPLFVKAQILPVTFLDYEVVSTLIFDVHNQSAPINSNQSFRLLSGRLRLKSVRLSPICQFAHDLYVKALKLNCLKVLVEPRRNTEY